MASGNVHRPRIIAVETTLRIFRPGAHRSCVMLRVRRRPATERGRLQTLVLVRTLAPNSRTALVSLISGGTRSVCKCRSAGKACRMVQHGGGLQLLSSPLASAALARRLREEESTRSYRVPYHTNIPLDWLLCPRKRVQSATVLRAHEIGEFRRQDRETGHGLRWIDWL